MYNFFTVTILRFVSIYFVLSVLIASYFYPGGKPKKGQTINRAY